MAPGANGGAPLPSSKPGTGRLPHCAGKDIVNPGSVILSGVMTLEIGYGWNAVTLPEETGRNGEHKHRPVATAPVLYSTGIGWPPLLGNLPLWRGSHEFTSRGTLSYNSLEKNVVEGRKSKIKK